MPATTEHYWLPADLEQLPEEADYRYECIDGALPVTPAPRPAHRVALAAGPLRLVLDVARFFAEV